MRRGGEREHRFLSNHTLLQSPEPLMQKFALLATMLMVALTPSVEAQTHGPSARDEVLTSVPDETAGPVYFLLSRRNDLGLRDEQVVRIEEIGARLRAENRQVLTAIDRRVADHQAEMNSERHLMGDRERQQKIEVARADLVPLVRSVIVANLRAMEAVNQALTEDQAEDARKLLKERRAKHATSLFAKRPEPAEQKANSGGH